MATALATLMSLPAIPLAPHATPVDDLTRLRAALGGRAARVSSSSATICCRSACGGNKVRKMQPVAAEARASGADTLITCGGLQSNHARATAAAGAALGLQVVLVLNGTGAGEPRRATRGSTRCLAPTSATSRRATIAMPTMADARRAICERPAAGRSSCRWARPRRPAPLGLRAASPRLPPPASSPTSSSTPRRLAARRPASLPAARSFGIRAARHRHQRRRIRAGAARTVGDADR